MPATRRGFYDQVPADMALDVLRERHVDTLMQPKRTVQRRVPLKRIRPNPFQARRTFAGIEGLVQGMRVHMALSRIYGYVPIP